MNLFLPQPRYFNACGEGWVKKMNSRNKYFCLCVFMCVGSCMRAPWMLENSGGLSTPGHQDKDKVSGPTLYIYITSLENPIFPFQICIYCSFESSQNTA